jgi:hypothetical protein
VDDYVRLAMALVIALLGLIAGAKEQLLKLDLLPGIVSGLHGGLRRGSDQESTDVETHVDYYLKPAFTNGV